MSVQITADALKETAAYFQFARGFATQAARLALNDVAKGPGLTLLRTAITDQVDFPAGYIGNDKLYVSKYATGDDLEVGITARMRPTSLARFAKESLSGKRSSPGVHVQVKASGGLKFMASAFLIRLRAGATLSDENFNVGLAIRLKPGQTVINKREQSGVQLSHNLYLLYGPSVDQVFREVASEHTEPVLDLVESEFFRQFARLSDAA